jgi:hypothetical protein
VSTEADLSGAKTAWPPREASAQELQKIVLRLGRKAKADFVVLCSYRQMRPDIELRLDCFEPAADNPVIEEAARRTLALVLDRTISDLMASVLQTIGPRLVYLPYVTEGEEGTAAPREERAAAQAPRPRGEAPPPPSFAPVEPVVHPLEVSLCLSPLFTVGEAADYFRVGFFPSVNGSYRLYTRGGHLSLGASLGALAFYAESPGTDASGYLVPLAATASFQRPLPDSRLSLLVRLASGPALFILNPQSAEAQAKVLVYLGAGIGAELALSAAWGVRLELDYAVFFEQERPIMGYAPALYGFYRF